MAGSTTFHWTLSTTQVGYGKLQAPLGTIIVVLGEYPAMSTTQMSCADRRNGARKMEFEDLRSERSETRMIETCI